MPSSTKRMANWDLLRSIAMFLVVVCHTQSYLDYGGHIPGISVSALSRISILCDPLFFMLSGFFALGSFKKSLRDYYLNKISTIILPMVVYSILLYLYLIPFSSMSLGNYFDFFRTNLENGWWFIPQLVPCLVAAPFLCKGLDALSEK